MPLMHERRDGSPGTMHREGRDWRPAGAPLAGHLRSFVGHGGAPPYQVVAVAVAEHMNLHEDAQDALFSAHTHDLEVAKAAGFRDLITKPFDLDTLVYQVKVLLDGSDVPTLAEAATSS